MVKMKLHHNKTLDVQTPMFAEHSTGKLNVNIVVKISQMTD